MATLLLEVLVNTPDVVVNDAPGVVVNTPAVMEIDAPAVTVIDMSAVTVIDVPTVMEIDTPGVAKLQDFCKSGMLFLTLCCFLVLNWADEQAEKGAHLELQTK